MIIKGIVMIAEIRHKQQPQKVLSEQPQEVLSEIRAREWLPTLQETRYSIVIPIPTSSEKSDEMIISRSCNPQLITNKKDALILDFHNIIK